MAWCSTPLLPWEVDAAGYAIQGHPVLGGKLEVSMGYTRPSQTEEKKTSRNKYILHNILFRIFVQVAVIYDMPVISILCWYLFTNI